jgi:hypothetical protein
MFVLTILVMPLCVQEVEPIPEEREKRSFGKFFSRVLKVVKPVSDEASPYH